MIDFTGAECVGHHDLFYAHPSDRPRIARALKICAACALREPCRELGRQGREHGIWGGETEEQRARAGYAPSRLDHKSTAAARTEHLRNERVAS